MKRPIDKYFLAGFVILCCSLTLIAMTVNNSVKMTFLELKKKREEVKEGNDCKCDRNNIKNYENTDYPIGLQWVFVHDDNCKAKEEKPLLTDLIKSKKFDYVNSNITNDLFPIPEKIGTEYRVYNFTNNYSSEEIVALMKTDGFTPATIWDLLYWKDWNGKDEVVALGSSARVDGDRYVPYLRGDGSERDLGLYYWDDVWCAGYRFLAVRTSSLRPFDTLYRRLEFTTPP